MNEILTPLLKALGPLAESLPSQSLSLWAPLALAVAIAALVARAAVAGKLKKGVEFAKDFALRATEGGPAKTFVEGIEDALEMAKPVTPVSAKPAKKGKAAKEGKPSAWDDVTPRAIEMIQAHPEMSGHDFAHRMADTRAMGPSSMMGGLVDWAPRVVLLGGFFTAVIGLIHANGAFDPGAASSAAQLRNMQAAFELETAMAAAVALAVCVGSILTAFGVAFLSPSRMRGEMEAAFATGFDALRARFGEKSAQPPATRPTWSQSKSASVANETPTVSTEVGDDDDHDVTGEVDLKKSSAKPALRVVPAAAATVAAVGAVATAAEWPAKEEKAAVWPAPEAKSPVTEWPATEAKAEAWPATEAKAEEWPAPEAAARVPAREDLPVFAGDIPPMPAGETKEELDAELEAMGAAFDQIDHGEQPANQEDQTSTGFDIKAAPHHHAVKEENTATGFDLKVAPAHHEHQTPTAEQEASADDALWAQADVGGDSQVRHAAPAVEEPQASHADAELWTKVPAATPSVKEETFSGLSLEAGERGEARIAVDDVEEITEGGANENLWNSPAKADGAPVPVPDDESHLDLEGERDRTRDFPLHSDLAHGEPLPDERTVVPEMNQKHAQMTATEESFEALLASAKLEAEGLGEGGDELASAKPMDDMSSGLELPDMKDLGGDIQMPTFDLEGEADLDMPTVQGGSHSLQDQVDSYLEVGRAENRAQERIAHLMQQQTELDHAIEKAYQDRLGGKISEELFNEKHRKWKDDKAKNDKELQKLRGGTKAA